jgi:hypothetical protein
MVPKRGRLAHGGQGPGQLVESLGHKQYLLSEGIGRMRGAEYVFEQQWPNGRSVLHPTMEGEGRAEILGKPLGMAIRAIGELQMDMVGGWDEVAGRYRTAGWPGQCHVDPFAGHKILPKSETRNVQQENTEREGVAWSGGQRGMGRNAMGSTSGVHPDAVGKLQCD